MFLPFKSCLRPLCFTLSFYHPSLCHLQLFLLSLYFSLFSSVLFTSSVLSDSLRSNSLNFRLISRLFFPHLFPSFRHLLSFVPSHPLRCWYIGYLSLWPLLYRKRIQRQQRYTHQKFNFFGYVSPSSSSPFSIHPSLPSSSSSSSCSE